MFGYLRSYCLYSLVLELKKGIVIFSLNPLLRLNKNNI